VDEHREFTQQEVDELMKDERIKKPFLQRLKPTISHPRG
jgi:hypothetical protein